MRRDLYKIFGVKKDQPDIPGGGGRMSGGGKMIRGSSLSKSLGLKSTLNDKNKTSYEVTKKGAEKAKQYNPTDYSMASHKKLSASKRAIRNDLAEELRGKHSRKLDKTRLIEKNKKKKGEGYGLSPAGSKRSEIAKDERKFEKTNPGLKRDSIRKGERFDKLYRMDTTAHKYPERKAETKRVKRGTK